MLAQVGPTGEVDDLVGDAGPAHPPLRDPARPRHPGVEGSRHRARRRRRVRLEAQRLRGGALAVALAKRLGRPVKWTEERSENYVATIHGRDVVHELTFAATKDGKITAVKSEAQCAMGAYLQLVTPGIPLLGAWIYSGPYAIPNYSVTFTGVFTHTTPTDAYRGAGRPEATYVIERTMDALAARARDGPCGAPPQELHHGVPAHDGLGPHDRLGRLPRVARPAARAARPRPRSGAEQAGTARARRREAARRRLLDLQRDVRPRPVSDPRRDPLRRRRLGLRPRSASSRSARCRSSRGRPRTARGTRRRGRRSSPTSWASSRRRRGAARRHGRLPAGDGHVRQPLARSRRGRALPREREDRRQGAEDRRAPARGLGGRPRVRERHVQGEGLSRPGDGHPGVAFQAHAAHNLPDGMEPGLEETAVLRPAELLLAGGRARRGRRGRHRDRGTRGSSATSRSTTSASR